MACDDLVYFTNSAGRTVYLSSPSISKWWELRGRKGFTAPEYEMITEEYINGIIRIIERKMKPRECTLKMVLVGDTTAQRDKAFFDMLDVLTDISKGELGKLYVRRSDGRIVYLNAAYTGGMNVEEQYRLFHLFELSFIAPDAYFYGVNSSETIPLTIGNIIRPHAWLKVGSGWKVGSSEITGAATITNDLGEVIEPVFRVDRSFSFLNIFNSVTQKTIVLRGLTLGAGQVLVIDTRSTSKGIYVENPDGTKTNAISILSFENLLDFPLEIGANPISVSGSGSLDISVSYDLNYRYKGA